MSTHQRIQYVAGVDINENRVALAAMNWESGNVQDSLVLEYLDVKRRRHECFTKRRWIQEAGQTAFKTVVGQEKRDSVHDQLHKTSRDVVRWVSQFENQAIVFGDPKDMRDSINYGTRMNRHLHSVPFAKLRDLITYKVARDGVPSDDMDPEYTSQRCPRTACLYTERGNRREKRFKCRDRGFQNLIQNPVTDNYYRRVLQTKFTLKQAKIIVAAGGGSGVQRTVWGRHLRRQVLAPDQSMRLGWSRERLSGAST
ncbi:MULTISPECIES: IS200/IS605 family accessory protein TnpB-related protein [Haloarcula]|uniref:IS200/IS605 family accessory protein TnpB-related protein n=1 Tax=Haloarcula TaxID=2237 RepID=UPI000F8F3E15|nr:MULTISPECIES: IS200/IS605 family accessory protein TnpB-related protein [Haloarcula]NHX41804.1 IS200/IS605 family element transposase accessory protein TnpB [Haloarcula sp. R1-2]